VGEEGEVSLYGYDAKLAIIKKHLDKRFEDVREPKPNVDPQRATLDPDSFFFQVTVDGHARFLGISVSALDAESPEEIDRYLSANPEVIDLFLGNQSITTLRKTDA
jgi:hypothetical protein